MKLNTCVFEVVSVTVTTTRELTMVTNRNISSATLELPGSERQIVLEMLVKMNLILILGLLKDLFRNIG